LGKIKAGREKAYFPAGLSSVVLVLILVMEIEAAEFIL